jgi:DNA polymerase III, beta subunit
MHFISTKNEILKAINIVSKATSKMQKTILECILFQCHDGGITLKATDISISIKTSLQAEVLEEGEVAIPARFLYEIISKFPESDVSFHMVSENTVEISCLNAKVCLQSMNPAEFPAFPEIETDKTVRVQEKLLRDMINQTIFSAATAEDKPILTGLMFQMEPNALEIVALDGYRMAVRSQQIISEIEASCVVPARTARDIARILEDSEKNVKITINGNMALFELDGTEVISRLLEGEYIKYKNLLPKGSKTDITIERELLYDAVERASVLAREGSNNLVKLEIRDNIMNISSNSEIGNMDENIPVIQNGDNLTIAFNAKYILDVLKSIEDKEVKMLFNTPISPCLIVKPGDNAYQYLILPVQVR